MIERHDCGQDKTGFWLHFEFTKFLDYCVSSHLFISTNLFHLKAHLITNFLLIHPQTKFHSDEQFFGELVYTAML